VTNLHLLRVAKVRRSLVVPIVVFTVLNAIVRARYADSFATLVAYVLFDIAMWIGVAFLVFAVIERRQKMRPQPRIAAMAAATLGIAGLATTVIALRALFGAILHDRPFISLLLVYLPAPFYAATFYVAIVTGIGYAVHSWAVDDRRLAEAAELDAAIARAELKAAAGRLQPEFLDAELARLATVMATDPGRAQQMISDLGGRLHEFLGSSGSSERGAEFLGTSVPRSSSEGDAEFLGTSVPRSSSEGRSPHATPTSSEEPEELRGTRRPRGTPPHSEECALTLR
jgi:hypothetical protein